MATTLRSRTIRAFSLAAPRQARVIETRTPEPGPREVLVELEGCGVCGSSIPVWEGRPWFTYPLEPGAPGHEGWGVVVELGDGVERPRPGTRVACVSSHALAELDVASAEVVVPLPPALDGRAFPGEPLGCAFNVLRRSLIAAGDRVAVVGTGFLGLLLVALATDSGAEVTAISRRPFGLALARTMGASRTLTLAAAEDEARETEDGEFDCVIEAAGTQETLDLGGRLTRVRGRLVLAGYHQEPRTVDVRLWNWRGLDVVNAHERDPREYVRGMREAVAAVAAGRLDVAPLLTHTLPLAHAGDAFRMAVDRPEGFVKAVVIP